MTPSSSRAARCLYAARGKSPVMFKKTIDRKTFMTMLARGSVGSCMCAAALSAQEGLGAGREQKPQAAEPVQAPQAKPGDVSAARAAKRMEFVDVWVPRFFTVMDAELDEPTRRRLMVANGKACFSAFQPGLKRRAEPATREWIADWVAKRGRARGYSMEGDAIIFEYVGSAETGQAAPERVCLCSTAEGQRAGEISPTFCWCSVGYVKEMHERVFGRGVNVALVQAVLMGHPRCRFRITLA